MSRPGDGAGALAARLHIASRWDGAALPVSEHALIEIERPRDGHVLVRVDAPFYDDAPPHAAVGPTERLWEHEVVELFFADAADHYLEVELGPHGHHLVLQLRGVRQVVRSGLPLDYSVLREPAGRFRGQARVPLSYFPAGVCRVNAYAIHGGAAARCHHAHSAPGGSAPDFHRLESFVPLQLA